MQNTIMNSGVIQQKRGLKPAFTLVELLVVIGIIALLIAILLPTLAGAREQAKRVVCATKLQQIMFAAGIHAAEHRGYWPLVGQIVGISGQSTCAALDDAYSAKYTYTGDPGLAVGNNGDQRLMAPIELALGAEMGYKANLLNLDLSGALTANGLNRLYTCPSQGSNDADLYNSMANPVCWVYAGYFGNYYGGFTDTISYVFNEGVLGFDDSKARLKGQSTRVKQPSKTFFACDGLGGSTKTRLSGTWKSFNVPAGTPPQPWPSFTIWNNSTSTPITMADALSKRRGGNPQLLLAGDSQNFDPIRHKGKMNVAFCDGHVEVRTLPAYTMDPSTGNTTFKNSPTDPVAGAATLSDIYVLPP